MIQCDACHRWTHEACNRAGAVVPLEPGSFKPGDVWIVSERESGGAGADEASGRGVDEAGSERRAKTTRSRIRDASAVTAEERRANVVLTAGAEDVFACDACHYRDACRPGHEPRVTSRFVVSENARSDDELAALALAPGAIPPSGALMDAETFCRLLCLRRGFTPLVSGIRCPTIQPSVDVSDAAYWAEEEAWEEEAAWEEEEEEGPGRRSTGANAAAPVGIAGPSPGASASAKPPPAPTPMSEKDRNEKRRGTEDVFCAASDAALAAERRRRGRFRSMLPAGIEEEDEQLRLAMDQSAAAYAEAADRERRRREREELAEAETTAYAAREDADAAKGPSSSAAAAAAAPSRGGDLGGVSASGSASEDAFPVVGAASEKPPNARGKAAPSDEEDHPESSPEPARAARGGGFTIPKLRLPSATSRRKSPSPARERTPPPAPPRAGGSPSPARVRTPQPASDPRLRGRRERTFAGASSSARLFNARRVGRAAAFSAFSDAPSDAPFGRDGFDSFRGGFPRRPSSTRPGEDPYVRERVRANPREDRVSGFPVPKSPRGSPRFDRGPFRRGGGFFARGGPDVGPHEDRLSSKRRRPSSPAPPGRTVVIDAWGREFVVSSPRFTAPVSARTSARSGGRGETWVDYFADAAHQHERNNDHHRAACANANGGETRPGWTLVGGGGKKTGTGKKKTGRKRYSGRCDRCGAECAVEFRPVVGGKPPTCRRCYVEASASAPITSASREPAARGREREPPPRGFRGGEPRPPG